MSALPLSPPAGMRDLLHPESTARASLRSRIGELFTSYGYDPVVTPAFEHADVLERGLATVDRRDLLRFVEPESGEVALLRPDITPQIARIVATQLRNRPGPYRLQYRGTVLRRRRGRARLHGQISQSGIEHIGNASVDADVEVATLACRAAEAGGLSAYRLELRHVRLVATLLGALPAEARGDARVALGQKDASELERILGRVTADGSLKKALLALPRLFGGRAVLSAAEAELPTALVGDQLAELSTLAKRLAAAGFADQLAVDLGETRGMAYYTGTSFALLARGPGEPVAAGGRYDELLGRFGAPQPATGFAMDLANLEWAAGRPKVSLRLRVALIGTSASAKEVAGSLRGRGAQVAELGTASPDAARAFADAWAYDAVVTLGDASNITRVADGAQKKIDPMNAATELAQLLDWAGG